MNDDSKTATEEQARKPSLPPPDVAQIVDDALDELVSKRPGSVDTELSLKEIAKQTGITYATLKKEYERKVNASNKKVTEAAPEALKTIFTVEELTAAKELSLQPNIYLPHREAYKSIGYCGRDSLKDAALTSNGKRLLLNTSADISTGGSSSGKSKLWDTEEKFLPPECVVSYTTVSEKGLNYIGNLKNKVFKMGELPPRRPNEGEDTDKWSDFRQLISDGKLKRGVPQKKEDGKGIELKEYITEGPCVIWATTTRSQQDFIDEVVNRCGWIPSDESEGTTNAVNAEQTKRDEKPQNYTPEDELKICRVWQAYNAGLKSYRVIIPYAHHLKPNPKYLTARRLYPLISNHVQVSALLHQATRQVEIDNEKQYLIATLADYENIHEQVSLSAPKVLDVVAPATLQAFTDIKDQLAGKKLTVADLMKLLAQTEATTRRWRQQYLNAGLLAMCNEKKGKAELVELGSVPPKQVESMALGIITPQKLREEIAKCTRCGEKLKDSLNEPTDKAINLSQSIDRQCKDDRQNEKKDSNLSTCHSLSSDSDRIETSTGLDSEQSINFSPKEDEQVFRYMTPAMLENYYPEPLPEAYAKAVATSIQAHDAAQQTVMKEELDNWATTHHDTIWSWRIVSQIHAA